MPVYFDRDKQRWRFHFNRVIRSHRHRASRLLPAGWDRTRAEKYDRIETGRLYAVATGVEQQDRLIDHAVALYLKHRIPKQKAGRKAAHHLAMLLPWYEGRPIEALPDVAREFAEDDHELAAGTVHNRLQYLKAACRYAWRHHWRTGADPTGAMAIPAANNERHVYLKHGKVKQLLRKIQPLDSRAIFTLSYYLGLRWQADVLPRQPGDVLRSRGQVWLNVGLTKNGTPRMKPVHPQARWALEHLPFQRHGRNHYKGFERARRELGLEHVTAHDLRHSLASVIIGAGGTLPDVQGALDHKSVVSARRYAHLYPERLRKVLFRVGK